tara:strand:+ start:262 stop:624 length:363 start_codon:yes stop_codon:yes gene_type:complete
MSIIVDPNDLRYDKRPRKKPQYRKKITNDKGISFNVILSKEGRAKYITFYDSRYVKNFTKYGQQVAKYYMNTLLGKDGYGGSIKNGYGLDLYGGVDDWYIDSKASNKLINWIEKTKHKLN